MRAIVELNHWNGPTEFIASKEIELGGHIYIEAYYASITKDTFDIDGEYEYDFWRLPPRPAESDGEDYIGGPIAKSEFTMKYSEIDWSDYESTTPWGSGVNKGGRRE